MMNLLRRFLPLIVLGLLALSIMPLSVMQARPSTAYSCPTTSTRSYSSGDMYQYDLDNPVRPAWNHADKNLALRSYSLTNEAKTFILYGSGDPIQPPQFATIFNPDRTAVFTNVYRANHWNWASSPDPGTQGGPITDPPVTVLGLETTPGEELESPTHGRDLGLPWGKGSAVVIFADEDSITLHFTRDDTAAVGYTVHIDNICTDPNLQAKYNKKDDADRNSTGGSSGNTPRDGIVDYKLMGLSRGQVFGTARGTEIRVAIVDTGSFQDPRSRDEWWQIRPSGSPPPPPPPPGGGGPNLISPTDGASTSTRPTFQWEAVSGAGKYKLQVSTSAAFAGNQIDEKQGATSFQPSSDLSSGQTYYWRVSAKDASTGIWGPWSDVWSFSTGGAPPPPPPPPGGGGPNLISPTDGASTSDRPTFQWEAVVGSVKYKIQVSTSASFASTVIQEKPSGASFQPASSLTVGETYYWRVSAKDDATGVWGPWSSVWSFQVP